MQAQQMTEAAKEARRAYHREWVRNNPDKVRAAQERFYQRIADRKEAATKAGLPEGVATE